ncbi:site-specific integrase [Sporofaciens musculi]|jgi:integrase|uniref:site-specific integrase n=1 Tax=Sporofaciens musculi TaxID=2681861 RepID=UPI0025707C85|nr:site-specific integrase [Sporofaciens musculi]
MGTLNLQTLVSGTAQALMEASASDYYQRVFKTLGRQLLIYADTHETDGFSMDFGLQFLEDHYHMSEKVAAKKWPVIYSRCINFISDYQRTGHIVLCFGVTKKVYTIPEGFQESMGEYLDYRKKIGISDKTIQLSLLYLERFFDFLAGEEIHSPGSITIQHVRRFLKYIGTMEKSSICANMRAVRYYLKYCYENSHMANELFSKIPNVYYNRQSRLPSSYTSDEVNTLLKSVDQGNPCGRRDYAIILLIARLGLRSSDVAGLRLSDIDWEKERLHVIQKKTGNPLELPLLEDVGEAIIRYLKTARPKTESDHVFIRQKPPYTGFQPGCVGALVCRYLQISGIPTTGRKRGSHILRHSLASRLLEHEIPLPVISEILGHTSTQTTMTYLRINIAELKKCALEVTV